MKGISERSAKERERIDAAQELWDKAFLVSGPACVNHAAARAYFAARGIPLEQLPAWEPGGQQGVLPETIRYLPAHAYWAEKDGGGFENLGESPALLFAVQDVFGDLISVHQIWLERDGSPRKRAVPDGKNKKLFRGPKPDGCCIRFGEPDSDSGLLPIGEGPETMLAVAAAVGIPTWCAISSGNLLKIQLPQKYVSRELATIKAVVFMVDHDGVSLAVDPILNYKTMYRTGWDKAAAAALRIESKYRGVKGLLCSPGMSTSTLGGLLKERGDMATDGFADAANGKKIDWLDALNAAGSERVLQEFSSARAIEDVRPECLATAPTARLWLAEGVPREYLSDDPETIEKAEKAARDQASAPQLRDEITFPKGAADRAEFALRKIYTPDPAVGSRWKLAYWIENSQWMLYDGKRYRLAKDDEVDSDVCSKLRGLFQQNKTGKVVPVDLTAKACGDFVKIMKSFVTVRGDGLPFMAPSVFDDQGKPVFASSLDVLVNGNECDPDAAKNLLGLNNGMLSIEDFVSGRVVMQPHSPRIISRSLVPFDLDVKALERELKEDPAGEGRGGMLVGNLCPTWLRILDEAFEGDDESIGELQKVAGYLLTEDMSHEVMPMLLGPPRGSKGLITLGISVGMGEDRVATTSFSSFGDKNETYNLVGRRAAIMTDAQQADPRDMHKIVERLKTITGGDPQSVEGKFKDKNPYIYLPVVPFIVANSVPTLIDPSNALAARVLLFKTRKSHVNKEDRSLKAKIRAEAHGIMLWALFGLRALRRDGKFHQPAASRHLLDQFKRSSSPMSAFLADVCVIHEASAVAFSVLYALYKAWAADNGRHTPSKDKFFSDMQANIPGVEVRSRAFGTGHNRRLIKMIEGVRPRLFQEEPPADGAEPEARSIRTLEPNDLAEFEFTIRTGHGDSDHVGGGGGGGPGIAYPQHDQQTFGVN